MRLCYIALSFAAAVWIGGSATIAKAAGGHEVTVAAASDLKFAFDNLTQEFEKNNPDIHISATFGSSGNFYSQLTNQAPFDMFLSADREFPDKLVRQGLTLPESVFSYALGRIAIWVPSQSPIDVATLRMNALKHSSIRHIAIANPQHAPYGRAAEAALRTAGLYDSVKGKLVFGENVSQALQFVQSGNADIGLVPLSLAMAPAVRGQGRYWEIPADQHPRLEQTGVILRWAKDASAAQAFRAFLLGRTGRAILKNAGFVLPGE